MKVIGYVRTSWAEQAQDGHPSVQEQEDQLKAFARNTGISLRTIHSDTGLSPKHGTCAGLVSILDDMDNDWDAVLVTTVDRLRGLNTISVDPVEELKQNGKHVLLANEQTAQALARHKPRVRATWAQLHVRGVRAVRWAAGPAAHGVDRDPSTLD